MTATGPSFDDLDGHSVEELVDYLDRGRTPVDPAIEASPACRMALVALERLRGMADRLLEEDASELPSQDGWVGEALRLVSAESRAGRRFPLTVPDGQVAAVVTEGALRALVRAIGDSVPGILVGRVRIDPIPEEGLVDLDVEAGVLSGYPLPQAAADLRRRVLELFPQHAPFAVRRIDVRVRDLIDGDAEAEA